MFKHGLSASLSILTVWLLILGCGGDEEPPENTITKPVEIEVPNYYPDSVGSRWVYRNSDGFEWGREVTEIRPLVGQIYHVFAYVPPIENPPFDYLRTPLYRVTRNHVLFFVGGEIDRSVKQTLTENLRMGFADAGNIRVNVDARSQNNLTFFRIPPSPGQRWEVINMKIKGNVVFLDFANLKLPFEMNWVITGMVVRRETVETPAGVFTDSFKTEYSTKITSIIEGEEETTREKLETVWLAPEVGMVKVESEDLVTELIEYDVK